MGKFNTPGVIHSYSGSADIIPVLESYGIYISFSGSTTNLQNKKVLNALKKVSKEGFVLETDAPDIYPYLDLYPDPAPDPHPDSHLEHYLTEQENTRLNEPKNLPAIAHIASNRIGMGVEEFAHHAYNNSLILFHPILPNNAD